MKLLTLNCFKPQKNRELYKLSYKSNLCVYVNISVKNFP